MDRSLKVFHAADLHYCPKHLDWVNKAFTFAVDHAVQSDALVAVIAGDSFDSSMGIHEPAHAAFIRQVVILAEAMPVLILQGTFSHDRPGSLDMLKHLPTNWPVYVADRPGQVYLMRSYDGMRWFEHEHDIPKAGAAADDVIGLFSCLPSLNKADPAIMEHGAQGYLQELFTGWAEVNARASAEGIPTAMVTHGTINGCITESGYAMVSPDWELNEASLYSVGADAVLMGHIHKHQSWTDGKQSIAYPGSIARLVHGHHDPVGFLMWDIFPDRAQFQFIETPSRQLLEIEFDGPPDMDELTELAARADENTHVRIRWCIDQEHAHSIDKQVIRQMFEHAGGLKLEGVVNPVVSVRAAGIGKAMTMEEKLGYYATTTGDEDKLDDLTARLQMVRTMSVDQIVTRLTNNDEPMRDAA